MRQALLWEGECPREPERQPSVRRIGNPGLAGGVCGMEEP
jgi:hypothetical protein